GSGLVQVAVDGRGVVRRLVIAPEAFTGRDAELLSDLVLSAVAEGQRRAAELASDEMRKVQPAPGYPSP
ncbi:MAG: YbaB/EbfC family nucleoid-associated protein, partial [Gemmatimonadales bacterium]|nr:YbaB/EbfC family nucleoid-associated protein [Gemmatimonadales bacterium]